MYQYELYDPFTSDEVFVEFLKGGGELVFSYNEKDYALGMTTEDEYIIWEVGNDKSIVITTNTEDILNYRVGQSKRRLRDVLLDIDINERSM